jgi:predicted PurR-regulated permease PerM
VSGDPRDLAPAPRVTVPRVASAEIETSVSPPPERKMGLTPLSLLIVLAIGYLLIQIQFVLVLVLLAVLFATVIERPVNFLERRHLPRPLAILTLYIAIIGGLMALFVLLAPMIRSQATEFREQAPQSLTALQQAWQESGNALLAGPGQQLLSRGIEFIANPGQAAAVPVPQGAAVGVLTGLGGGVIGFVTLLIIAFYYLMEKAWIRHIALMRTSPETRVRISRVWDEVEQKLGDWLRGQLTLCLIIGLAATFGYALMGIKFWPLLGLWAGLTEFLPILGPWLGGIPAVIIALTQGWHQALLVIGFVVLLQMTENAILVPRIMRGAVGLTPLTVFVAILAGTEFAGVAGALLAIPVAGAIQVLIANYVEARREARLGTRAGLPGWRWMRGPAAPPGFAPGVSIARSESAERDPAGITISPPE